MPPGMFPSYAAIGLLKENMQAMVSRRPGDKVRLQKAAETTTALQDQSGTNFGSGQ